MVPNAIPPDIGAEFQIARSVTYIVAVRAIMHDNQIVSSIGFVLTLETENWRGVEALSEKAIGKTRQDWGKPPEPSHAPSEKNIGCEWRYRGG